MPHPTRPPVKDSHCSFCGSAYPPGAPWPRTCARCARTVYRNPLPVAVALQPVRDGDRTGLVVIRRAIEPSRGLLALPGGFVDHGETWQQAVVRELAEETGIPADPGQVRLADVLSDTDGYLLVFGLLPLRDADGLPPFTPTAETTARQVLTAPAELGFPLHTAAARAWFAGRREPPSR